MPRTPGPLVEICWSGRELQLRRVSGDNHCVLALVLVAADLSIPLPITAVILGAALALAWNFFLKRREERRELRALVRLLDGELAGYESALTALGNADGDKLRAAAYVAQQAGSGAVWEQTKLDLARHLRFDEWDSLRDVYAVIAIAWLDVETPDSSESERSALFAKLPAAFDREHVAPRLLEVVAIGREVCQRHLGGIPPVKVPLSDEPATSELSSGD